MLRACGISAFWVPPTGQPLTGQLKSEPEDFVVVEVDRAGKRTDSATYDFAEGAGGASASSFPASVNVCESVLGDVTDASVDVTESATAPEPILDVEALLDASDTRLVATLGTLEAVAAQALSLTSNELSLLVHEISTGRPSSAADDEEMKNRPWWSQRECILSWAAYSKTERKLLHGGVRASYTYIRTRTRLTNDFSPGSTEGEEKDEVLYAIVDPHYLFFTYLFNQEVAEAIALWSRAQTLADPKLADADRELFHRLSAKSITSSARASLSSASPSLSGQVLRAYYREAPPLEANDVTADAAMATLSEKDLRRAFHGIMRRFYPFIKCQVTEGCVTMRVQPPRSHMAGVRRGRNEDGDASASAGTEAVAASTDEYVYMIVKKRNLDTAEMRKLLAMHLSATEGQVTIAGMKDKKAVTYQRCSVPLTKASGALGSPALDGDAHKCGTLLTLRWPTDPQRSYLQVLWRAPRTFKAPIHIGELSGNWFSVRLRSVIWGSCENVSRESDAAGTVDAAAKVVVLDALRARFEMVTNCGFINYFGQQRFSESVLNVQDHTGVHLFAGRYVAAVRSLYRACPEVYAEFPAKMESRFAPRASRDAQVMTHALRQTYRMYFSEFSLSKQDVEEESPLWTRVCERAICDGVPFALRSMWVHAAQSLFFNLSASFIVQKRQAGRLTQSQSDALASLRLPLGGYCIDSDRASAVVLSPTEERSVEGLVASAGDYACEAMGLSSVDLSDKKKVAGVPVPGSWRALLVVPQDASLETSTSETGDMDARLSFYLPSSCYATVFLREVLFCDEWWSRA